MQEKKQGLGEDSTPLLLTLPKLTILGVLDGMGGAGSSECDSDFGKHTQAYIASRIVGKCIEDFFNNKSSDYGSQDFAVVLRSIIKERFQQEQSKYPIEQKIGLRGSMTKTYPSTLALLCITQSDEGYILDSYWAGDSRNYLWNREALFQLSIDDVKGGMDPLRNLREDAPISNCLQADADFEIHHRQFGPFPTGERFLVISATDGCFGYFPSPMDFEKSLNDALLHSSKTDEWQKLLSRNFARVTGDDFSYVIAAFGYKDFKELKRAMANYRPELSSYFRNRKRFDKEMANLNNLQKSIDKLKRSLNQDIDSLWPDYKNRYLKYFKD